MCVCVYTYMYTYTYTNTMTLVVIVLFFGFFCLFYVGLFLIRGSLAGERERARA